MERRRPAGRLSRRDRLRFRPDRGGRRHGHRQRSGRLDVRPAADRPPGRDRHQVPEPGLHHAADRDVVRADEHAPGAVRQRQGAPGRGLRHRPQGAGQPVRRAEPRARRSARSCRPASPGTSPTAPSPRTPATKWTAPDLEKAKQLVQESGTAGQEVTIIVAGRDGGPQRRRLPAERAERPGLQGQRQGDLVQHPVHLHPEHQQQGADERHAVVPGLPCGLGLPQRPVRLRLVPRRLRQLDQHRGLLRRRDREADAGGAWRWP